MKKRFPRIILAALAASMLTPDAGLLAQATQAPPAAQVVQGKPPAPAVVVPPLHRPRDRYYDVINYRLTIEADLKTKTVAGEAEVTLAPVRPGLDVVRLDAWSGMKVTRVRVDGTTREFIHSGDTLEIPLGKPRAVTDTLVVAVLYSTTAPPKGLYFSGPDESDPEKPYQVYSQGEMDENHYWFPCYDFPNDRATSEMIATVATPFTATSNGRLVGVQKDASGAKTTWHWKEELPHVSYLVSLTVGEYSLVEDSWRGKPILNYVYKSNAKDAPRSFEKTPAMMDFFSDLTGYPYPWEKYGHTIVQDFIYGGQENVTITTLTDNTIHDARAHLDRNSDGLVAHELAHQWFGDLVSFRDWSEAWLSEGFATYLTLLSEGNINGKDEYSYQLMQTQADVTNADVGDRRRPTVTKRYTDPGSLFDNRIYGKGGCVLHMLRKTVGDTLFLKGLRKYVADYAFKVAETNQFRVVMEEVTGHNLDWFFDQWAYGAGYPKFDVSQKWDEATRTVSVTVTQTQTPDSLTGIFTMPVDILVWVGDDPETYTETITDSVHVFTYPAYREPKLIIFDKGSNILKTATFNKPVSQWVEQLLRAGDAADRVAAVHELRWTVDTPAVKTALLGALIRDEFWGVRYEAALALADSKVQIGDELVPGYGDRDARVRGAVVRALGNFKGGELAVKTMRHAFDVDSSYVVAANALRGLVKADSANSLPLCLEALSRDSQDDQVRTSALRSLATYKTVPGVADTVRAYTVRGRARNMRVLAVSLLAKNWPTEDELEYVATLLEDPVFHVRRAAIDALGNAGNEDSLEPLRRRLATETNDRLLQSVREAIKKIEDHNQ
jgi:aminopeptidase N